MNATATALDVIRWALGPKGPPPRGEARDANELARPAQPLLSALRELIAVASSRLRLVHPPLGDDAPVGYSPLILAAAVGVRSAPHYGDALLQAMGQAKSASEWIARHAITDPALAHLSSMEREPILAASPLTGLLTRPAPGQYSASLRVALALLRDRHGRKLLERVLARPTADAAIRDWRYNVLNRLRHDVEVAGMSFVLDVYESLMIHHQREAMAQVATASSILSRQGPDADNQGDERLTDALSVARWWSPLRALEARHLDQVRRRRYLDYPYRYGIHLCNRAERLTGERL